MVFFFRKVEREDKESVRRERCLTRRMELRDRMKPKDFLDCLDRKNLVQRTQK